MMKHSNQKHVGSCHRQLNRFVGTALVMAILSLGVNISTPSVVRADIPTIQEFDQSMTATENLNSSPYVVTVRNDAMEETLAATPSITNEEEVAIQEEIIQSVKQEELDAYVNSIYCDPNDVSKITNLKLEDMILLTKGTWWEGYEESLYNLEQTYHINAAFAMAVSSLESGCGTSSRARSKNNFYGLETGTSYSSRYHNTSYFGDLLNRKYVGVGKKSVYAIGPKYCPPNRQWEKYMANYMSGIQTKLRNAVSNRGV